MGATANLLVSKVTGFEFVLALVVPGALIILLVALLWTGR
jgi:hypothetical protein